MLNQKFVFDDTKYEPPKKIQVFHSYKQKQLHYPMRYVVLNTDTYKYKLNLKV
jgi:hypothetical protein